MSGAIMQLIATGVQNRDFNIPRNLAVSYFTEDFQEAQLSNTLCVSMTRDCDAKIPEYLEFEFPSNYNFDNFKMLIHKVSLDILIGGQQMFSIPLRFMMHLKNYEICDNKIYISIPFQMFCSEIKMIALSFHDVNFVLTNVENIINIFSSFKLISKGIFYDTDIRRELATNTIEEIIQTLASLETTSLIPRNDFKYNIPFDGIHKGFYIECENVDEINEIRLSLAHNDRFHYNRFFVRTKCVKISQQLLYFPMNFDKSHQNRSPEDFEGSLNLSRIDVAMLNIKLDTLNTKICLYGLGSNILRTLSGMCGLRYSQVSSFNLYCDYQENGIYNNLLNLIHQPLIQTDVQESPLTTDIQETGNIVHKAITDDKKMCCITHDDIANGERYMNCSKCNNNFKEEPILQWLRQRTELRQQTTNPCPLCRQKWSDFNIYINSEEPNNQDVVNDSYLDPPTAT